MLSQEINSDTSILLLIGSGYTNKSITGTPPFDNLQKARLDIQSQEELVEWYFDLVAPFTQRTAKSRVL